MFVLFIMAGGVPFKFAVPQHPLFRFTVSKPQCEGSVSFIYKKLQENTISLKRKQGLECWP